MSPFIHRAAAVSAVTLALAACSTDAVSPPALGSVVIVSGDAQTGTPGQPLPDSLVARVLSVTGQPMSGVEVAWRVTYGASTLTHGTDTSDANGDVRAALTLDPAPGVTQVVVTAADLPGPTFTATGRGLQAVKVAVSFEAACAIDVQGRTWCWGVYPGNGQALPATYVPSLVADDHHFKDIGVGDEHSCGLETDGSVWCWGLALYGDLGSGGAEGTRYYSPIRLDGGPVFAHIFGSDGFTSCGVTSDGTAYCWGANDQGQLGSGDTATAVPIPTPVAGGHKFRSISIGYTHACGVALDGSAWCWGTGTLGNGPTSSTSRIPVAVSGGYQFRSITASSSFTCGLTTSAGWVCWGPLPASDRTLRLTPTPEPQPALQRYSEIAAGGLRSAAISGPQAVSLTGWDEFVTPATDAQAPVRLHSLSGGFWTACALAQDQSVYCWGGNTRGELGSPDGYGWDSGAWNPAHAVVVPPGY